MLNKNSTFIAELIPKIIIFKTYDRQFTTCIINLLKISDIAGFADSRMQQPI